MLARATLFAGSTCQPRYIQKAEIALTKLAVVALTKSYDVATVENTDRMNSACTTLNWNKTQRRNVPWECCVLGVATVSNS